MIDWKKPASIGFTAAAIFSDCASQKSYLYITGSSTSISAMMSLPHSKQFVPYALAINYDYSITFTNTVMWAGILDSDSILVEVYDYSSKSFIEAIRFEMDSNFIANHGGLYEPYAVSTSS